MHARSQILERHIRAVPDFPKPGILFRDITPLLAQPAALRTAIELMVEPYRNQGPLDIVGIESRGFLFGIAMALELGCGFVPVRKPGKLPAAKERIEYSLEYGTDSLEIHRDALTPGRSVVIVDDLLATGGTLNATVTLSRRLGAQVLGAAVLIELTGLGGRQRVDCPLHCVLGYP
jgi:adenine phosphoribosyltransferase